MGIKVLPIWARFSMLLFSVIVAAQPSSVGRRLETMSGAWDGGAGGSGNSDRLWIRLETEVEGVAAPNESPKPLSERITQVSVSGAIWLDDFNWSASFPVFQSPGVVTLSDHRLNAQVSAKVPIDVAPAGSIPIDLDMTYDETAREWRGTLGVKGTSKAVRFSRPLARAGQSPTGFAGYWCSDGPDRPSCVGIVEWGDSTLEVWEDTIGPWVRGYGLRRDSTLFLTQDGSVSQRRTYGERQRLVERARDSIAFQSMKGMGTGVGPPIFSGRLSSDGTRIEGELRWVFVPPNMGYDPRPRTFVKSSTGIIPPISAR